MTISTLLSKVDFDLVIRTKILKTVVSPIAMSKYSNGAPHRSTPTQNFLLIIITITKIAKIVNHAISSKNSLDYDNKV